MSADGYPYNGYRRFTLTLADGTTRITWRRTADDALAAAERHGLTVIAVSERVDA